MINLPIWVFVILCLGAGLTLICLLAFLFSLVIFPAIDRFVEFCKLAVEYKDYKKHKEDFERYRSDKDLDEKFEKFKDVENEKRRSEKVND